MPKFGKAGASGREEAVRTVSQQAGGSFGATAGARVMAGISRQAHISMQ